MKKSPEKFERTTEGLRDAIMSEMEDIRAGIATPDEAHAFSALAEKVIRSFEADLAAQFAERAAEQEQYERKEKIRKREAKQLRLAAEKKAAQLQIGYNTEVEVDHAPV